MKQAWMLLLLAACTGGPSERPEETGARRRFEAWCDAVVRMDIDQIWAGMSAGLKSQWLYDRLTDPADQDMPAWRRELKGAADQELELWILRNKELQASRPVALPRSLLGHPWLLATYRRYHEPMKERMAREFQKLKVIQVAADKDGATLVVKNPATGGSDRYIMVWEGEWKVDRHLEPAPLKVK